MSSISKSIETESWLVMACSWAHWWESWGRNGDWLLMGMGFLFGWWKCSKIDWGNGCKLHEKIKSHWTLHLKWVDFMEYDVYLNKSREELSKNRPCGEQGWACVPTCPGRLHNNPAAGSDFPKLPTEPKIDWFEFQLLSFFFLPVFLKCPSKVSSQEKKEEVVFLFQLLSP